MIAAIAIPASAQNQRRAAISGANERYGGKCTVEVVVDGAAEIEIRGDTGTIRTESGRPAEWRRFECTSPIPRDPVDFRFRGIDGRGRQQLLRDPRSGGVAVVRIEDREGGAEGYTFDLTWGGGGLGGDSRWYDEGSNPRQGGYYGDRDRMDNRYGAQQAISECQSAVRQEAARRFGSGDVEFLGAQLADNPGARDSVIGAVDVRGARGYEDRYQFSCTVNTNNGRVRSVRLDPVGGGSGYVGSRDREDTPASVTLERCQGAVTDRLRQNGYGQIEFNSIRIDNRAGARDRVVGAAQASRGGGFESFDFNCSVDLRGGSLRSVDVNRR
jgi:hypothetical protein